MAPPLTSVNTTGVRRQAGAVAQEATFQERGILELKFGEHDTGELPPLSTIPDDARTESAGFLGDIGNSMTPLTLDPFLLYCVNCLVDNSRSVYYVDARLKSVFTDAIYETGNPALALQAFFTIMMQMAYYDFLSFATIGRDAMITMIEEASVPTRSGGFIAIAALIIVHMVLISLSTAIFVRRTQHTLLHNSWQVITGASDLLKDNIIAGSSSSSDCDIRKALKAEGRHDEVWVLTGEDLPRDKGTPQILDNRYVAIRKRMAG